MKYQLDQLRLKAQSKFLSYFLFNCIRLSIRCVIFVFGKLFNELKIIKIIIMNRLKLLNTTMNEIITYRDSSESFFFLEIAIM
jgi:hypothetical protein